MPKKNSFGFFLTRLFAPPSLNTSRHMLQLLESEVVNEGCEHKEKSRKIML